MFYVPGAFCAGSSDMLVLRSVIVLCVIAFLPPSAIGECIIPMPASGAFPNNNGTNDTPIQQVAGISVQCDTEYRLGLGGGDHLAGSRRMSDGAGHYIPYFLWQDSGGNTEWGDSELEGSAYPAPPLADIGNGLELTHPVYGTAMTAGALSPGLYTDEVRVLLAYPPYGPDDKVESDLFLSLELSGTCTLDASGLNSFGVWPSDESDLLGIPLGAITVTCTTGTNYSVGMNAGENYMGGVRNMRSGANLIPYLLWADSARTILWGDAGLAAIEPAYVETHPAPAHSAISTAGAQSFFVWGDAAISGKPAGTYRDTVIITVVWQ